MPRKVIQQEKVWLDSMEAAAYIGQSLRWIRRAVVEQSIPHYKMVGTVRYKRTELDEWLEERRVEVAPRPTTRSGGGPVRRTSAPSRRKQQRAQAMKSTVPRDPKPEPKDKGKKRRAG